MTPNAGVIPPSTTLHPVHRGQSPAHDDSAHCNNHGRIQGSKTGCHLQVQGWKDHVATGTTTTGMAWMVKGWWRVKVEGRARSWHKEDEGGTRSGEERCERDGRSEIGPPTANERSDDDVPLDVDYVPKYTTYGAKTTMQWAPMAPPLPPPPESNIDPCCQSQASNLALPSCIPHCHHGGSRLSGAFLPPPSSYLSFPLSQINATQHTGGAVKIVDSTTFTVSTTIVMAEVTVNPGAMWYEMVIVSSNFRRLRES